MPWPLSGQRQRESGEEIVRARAEGGAATGAREALGVEGLLGGDARLLVALPQASRVARGERIMRLKKDKQRILLT